jgi:hypothetical protein
MPEAYMVAYAEPNRPGVGAGRSQVQLVAREKQYMTRCNDRRYAARFHVAPLNFQCRKGGFELLCPFTAIELWKNQSHSAHSALAVGDSLSALWLVPVVSPSQTGAPQMEQEE